MVLKMKDKEKLILEMLKKKGKKYYELIKKLAESFIYEQDVQDQEGGYYEVEVTIKRSVLVEADCVDEAREKAKDQRFWMHGRLFKKDEISTGVVVQKFAKGNKTRRTRSKKGEEHEQEGKKEKL
jgi:hypothetical protein